MSLFSFRNEFDGVTVSLDAADHTPDGPFTVSLVYDHDSSVADENEEYEFPTLNAAYAKYEELIKIEIAAVLGEVDSDNFPPV